MPKSKRPTLGPCGEYYVASFLAGMGLVVELCKPGAQLVDMYVAKKKSKHQLAIQVKAGGTGHNHWQYKKERDRAYNHRVWPVGKKAFGYSKRSHWYAFVTVGKWPLDAKAMAPEIYFIPSRVVAKVLRENRKNQRSWFWIYDKEIEQYRGLPGYRKLRAALA